MLTGLASPTHLLLILVVILLLFGAKRLPELGRSMGRSVQEFKEGLTTKEEVPNEAEEKHPPEAVEGVQQNPNSVKSTQQEEEQHQRSQTKEEAAT